MKYFLFILLTILPFTANGESFNTAKVVAGKTVSEKTTPIAYIDYNFTYPWNYCSGVLIAPNKVLTAAHCVGDRSGHVSSIITKRKVKIAGKTYKIKKAVIAPNYYVHDAEGTHNDLAVITLARKAKIKPWPIVLKQKVKRGNKAYFYGYGRDYAGKWRVLKRGSVKINSTSFGTLYSELRFGMDIPCFGDDGGPVILVKNEKQIGVIGIIKNVWSEEGECTDYPQLSAEKLSWQYSDIKQLLKQEAPRAKVL